MAKKKNEEIEVEEIKEEKVEEAKVAPTFEEEVEEAKVELTFEEKVAPELADLKKTTNYDKRVKDVNEVLEIIVAEIVKINEKLNK